MFILSFNTYTCVYRKKERESEGRNDSVFTDEVGDTIASRTKQRRRNRQQDDDDEDDDNNSYEY